MKADVAGVGTHNTPDTLVKVLEHDGFAWGRKLRVELGALNLG